MTRTKSVLDRVVGELNSITDRANFEEGEFAYFATRPIRATTRNAIPA
jgi:hypothetical protein